MSTEIKTLNGYSIADTAAREQLQNAPANIAVTEIEGGSRLTITFGSGSTKIVDVMDGEDGYTPQKGKDYFDGDDGFSPAVVVSNITGGHRITITDANGTKTVDVMDGEKGDPGYTPVKGTDYFDGVSPTITVGDLSGGSQKGHMIIITDADGEHFVTVMDGEKGEPGYTPVKGTDYYTSADKSEMVNQVKAALASETWTFTLSGGATVTKKVVVA